MLPDTHAATAAPDVTLMARHALGVAPGAAVTPTAFAVGCLTAWALFVWALL